MKWFFAVVFLLAASIPASAKDATAVEHLRDAPASLSPDKAYLLFTSSRAKSGMMRITHVFLRVPTEAEMASYQAAQEAGYQQELERLQRRAGDGPVPSVEDFSFSYDGPDNIFPVNLGRDLKSGDGNTFLLEVPPGTYVLVYPREH